MRRHGAGRRNYAIYNMKLSFDLELVKNYTSPSQKVRVLTVEEVANISRKELFRYTSVIASRPYDEQAE